MCEALHIDLSVIIDTPHCTPDGVCRFVRKLGWGAEGAVWEAVDSRTNATVAVKTIDGSDNQRRVSLYNKLIELRHPNVISVLDVQTEQSRCFIIMEKCQEDLLQVLSRSPWRRFSEASASNFIVQTLAGLTACHTRGIFHGDVKPENILLTESGQVKLCDFLLGDSNSDDLISERMIGSAVYVAPEIYDRATKKSRSRPLLDLAASDVWSLGVTLFAIVAGHIPWHKPSESDQEFSRFVSDSNAVFPSWFSSPLKSLLRSMLQVSPDDRISLRDIWLSSWIVSHSVDASPKFTPPISRLSKIQLLDQRFSLLQPSSPDLTDSELDSDKLSFELSNDADVRTESAAFVRSPSKAAFSSRRCVLSPSKRKKQRRGSFSALALQPDTMS